MRGLVEFRRRYTGALWLEVMLVRGLNDSEQDISDLADALARSQPDEVQINVPTRPTAEPWVEAPERATLRRAETLLGGVCGVLQPVEGDFKLSIEGDVIEDVSAAAVENPNVFTLTDIGLDHLEGHPPLDGQAGSRSRRQSPSTIADLTVSTGTVAVLTTLTATDPMRMCSMPESPRVASTTRSQP